MAGLEENVTVFGLNALVKSSLRWISLSACVVRTDTPSAGSVNEKPNLAAMAVAFDVKSDDATMVGDNDGGACVVETDTPSASVV